MTENKTYEETKANLRHTPKSWLITGAAGFIVDCPDTMHRLKVKSEM